MLRRRNKLPPTRPQEVMSELLGMPVSAEETTDDLAARITDVQMRRMAELKVRGYYTPELQRLQDAFESSEGPERDDLGHDYVAAIVKAHNEMPRRPFWRRVTGL
jgi:hypothetical protein